MVVRFLSNTNPTNQKGLATVLDAPVIIREDEDQDAPFVTFNINDYDCCYEELAVAELDNDLNESWKSDKSSFLFKKSLPTDSIEILLFKCENGEEVQKAELNDDTLGTFFGYSYFGDDLRVGFLLDWRKVLQTFDTGIYFIRANREIINRDSVVQTHDFRLLPYREDIVNETVRIHTFSRGIIEGGIDYTGDGVLWEQMVRIRGKFWNPQKTFETDNYQDTNRNILQIQDQITTQYDLQLQGIPAEIGEPLLKDKILANKIVVTDYNLFNYKKYREVELYPVEIFDQKFFRRTARGYFAIRFTDKVQDIIKRNFL